MNRPAIAADASPSCGSSLDSSMNRLGSVPVHCSRYLRFTVNRSSPDTDSSRSTTTLESRPFKRASRDDGERFADHRRQPEVAGQASSGSGRRRSRGRRARRGSGRSRPSRRGSGRQPGGSSAGWSGRSGRSRTIRRARWAAVSSSGQRSSRNPSQRVGSSASGSYPNGTAHLVEELGGVASSSRLFTSSSPLAQLTITPVCRRSSQDGLSTLSGRWTTAASASTRSLILLLDGIHAFTLSPELVDRVLGELVGGGADRARLDLHPVRCPPFPPASAPVPERHRAAELV